MESTRQNARNSMKRVLRPFAGTLLEVLVSLVVLLMLIQTVTQISSRMRSSRMEMRSKREGIDKAITWKSAFQRGETWAQGDEGEFPQSGVRWCLKSLQSQKLSDSEPPDAAWRKLELRRKDEATPFWHMVVRIAESPTSMPIRPTHGFSD